MPTHNTLSSLKYLVLGSLWWQRVSLLVALVAVKWYPLFLDPFSHWAGHSNANILPPWKLACPQVNVDGKRRCRSPAPSQVAMD